MTKHDATADVLRARLAELNNEVEAQDVALTAPLDADFAEQASELEIRDTVAPLQSAHRAEANAINAALTRIAAGTYGVCANCGCTIPAARLAAVPTATTCIACAA